MKLSAYIEEHEPSIEAFIRKVKVGRSTVRRLIAGRPATLRVAKEVSKATNGAVSIMTLLEGSK